MIRLLIRIVKGIGAAIGIGARALVVLVGIAGITVAIADNYTMTEGVGKTFGAKLIGAVYYVQMLVCDATSGTTCAAVKAGNTAAAADVGVVVADPNVLAAVNSGVGPTSPGPASTNSILSGGVFTSGGVSLSNGQQAATQFDSTGHLLTTNGAGDPCRQQVATFKPFSITTATTTNIVTGTAAKKLYVCYLYMQTAAANNVAVISGTTGATCGANTAALVGGTTAANGLNNAANGGQAMGNGGYAVMQVATANDDICIITSASTPLAGVIKYVVQ